MVASSAQMHPYSLITLPPGIRNSQTCVLTFYYAVVVDSVNQECRITNVSRQHLNNKESSSSEGWRTVQRRMRFTCVTVYYLYNACQCMISVSFRGASFCRPLQSQHPSRLVLHDHTGNSEYSWQHPSQSAVPSTVSHGRTETAEHSLPAY